MEVKKNKNTLTTVGIDQRTNKVIDKLCKRYEIKKGEMVKLAFEYLDKASINPTEAPESAKAEIAKVLKRLDDVIRFIQHFEESQLNPMVRATHEIGLRFDDTVASLKENLDEKFKAVNELETDIQKRVSATMARQHRTINILWLMSTMIADEMDGKQKRELRDKIRELLQPKS